MKRVLLLFSILIYTFYTNAQVTIGSAIAPEGGALLDLKEFQSGSLNETAKKGILYPRVELKDNYRKELHPMYDVTNPDYVANEVSLKKSHIGLTVYNVTSSSYFIPGMYMWNGEEWRKMADSPIIEATISDLLCETALITPSSYSMGQPYDGILRISYLGGSGGLYDGTVPSSPINGLRVERIGGQLAIGGGERNVSGIGYTNGFISNNYNISY